MPNEQLAAALLGGGGGNAVLGLDPALLQAQSEMQTGQALQQAGMSTASAYPAQGWARLAQALAGTAMRQAATSDLAHAMAGSAEEMAKIFPAGTPLGDMFRSKSPVARMIAMNEAGKAAVLNNAPFHLGPADEYYRQAGTGGAVASGQPQSTEGKLDRDRRAAAAAGNVAGADIMGRIENKPTYLENGVQTPNPFPDIATKPVRTVPYGPPKVLPPPPPAAVTPPRNPDFSTATLGPKIQDQVPPATGPTNAPTQVAQSLPQQLGEAAAVKQAPVDALKDYNEKSVPNNEAAVKTLKALDLIDQNAAKLGPRWMGMGASEKVAAAKAINSTLDSFGLTNVPHFDLTKIAAAEDFKKESTRLGFELAKTLGSREAQMIVQQAISSVPNLENSPLGAKYVSAAVRADANRVIQQHEYKTNLVTQGKSLVGADVAFNKLHPPKEYAMQAITAQIPPQAIADLRNAPKTAGHFDATFGPGTAEYLLHAK